MTDDDLDDDLDYAHPLARKIIDVADVDDFYDHPDFEGGEIDAIIRDYLHRDTLLVSGVKFADHPDTEVEVAGTFIESGNQIQMALIGSEPVILVQPEYDADADKVTLLLTTVDLPPAGLIEVLETLLDATKQIAEQQEDERLEQEHQEARRG